MKKKRKKFGRKLLSFLLALAMVIGLMPEMSLTAYAAWGTLTDSSTNWTGDPEAKNTVTINDNVTVTGNTWLHCTHDVTVNGSLTVNAYLCVQGPGKLYVNGNVVINSGKTLCVYGSDDGTRDGVLVANAVSGDCITGSGKLEVSGRVTASGGENGVGIKGVILSHGTLYGSDAAAINEENKKDSPYQKPGLQNSVDYESHRYMYVDYVYVDAQTLSAGDTFSAGLRGIKNCTSVTLQAGGYTSDNELTPGTETTTVSAIGNQIYFYNGKIDDMGCGEYSPYANGKVVNFWQVVSNSEGALVLTGYEISHTHNFTYSADSDTITATCGNDGCDLTDSKAILTIAAPTLTTYGGTGSATATLTGLDAFNTATDKTIAATDIKYVGRDGTTYTESTTVPSNAGKYTASITVEEQTASVDYEIAKADTTALTVLNATCGQTLADVTLPDGWTWADSTQSVGSVGSNTFKANFAGDINYNAASDVDVTVTVSKAANPAIVADTATVTEGGNTVDLAGNVTLNGATGEVTYAIDGEANGCTLSGSMLTSGDNTGSVTVNVSVAADSNYKALAATPITVTINDKGTQTITAENVTASYGDTDKSVSASVTDPATGGGAISYAVKDGSADYIDVNASTGALTIKKVPADGKAYVVVTAAETAVYAQATKDVTVTISKANAVPATVTANNRTYDGTEKPLVNVTSEATGGTMNYAIGSDATTAPTKGWGTSIPAKTDAGTYYVWYKVVGDVNHSNTEAQCVTANIRAAISKTVTFKVANGSWNDGKTQDVTVTLNGYEGDTLKLTSAQIPAVGSKAADTFKAGSWDVTPSTNTAISQNTTYTYTYAKKDTISAKVTFKVANGSWNDGTTADKTVTLTGYEGDTLKLTADQIPAVGSKAADTFKAGSWDVTPSTNTAISQNTTYTYTYAKKDTISATVTFKVANGSWNDGKTQDVTVTLNGYEGDTLKLTSAQIPAVGSKAADTFKAGSWDVTPSTNTAITANTIYTYTYAKKDTISAKVTFKAANGSWNDGTTADKTVTLTGYEGDTLKLTADQIPAVGSKAADTFKAGSWDVTPSTNTAITANTTYTYTYEKKDTISAKVTFKVVNGSWNDGKTKDVTVTLSGYEGDTLKLTADQIPAVGSKAADTFKAGSWDVTPSTNTAISQNTTYTYTYAKKDTISATVTFKVANGSWNDGKTQDVTVTLNGYEGDTLKLTSAQIPAVGSKAADTFKAGSWDVTPSTNTEITANTIYTYTYAKKDTISVKVTFKVANGSWNDGTTADKTVTLTGYEGDTLKLTADQIPAVGSKAADTYKAGSWDVTPSTNTAITENTTYTYTYAKKDTISAKVTFKVVNGSWNDGTTADKTVTLTGYEGDTLKLTSAQIPAVGSKAADTFKAGSWDVTPNAKTAITGNTTYTYTYAKKDTISAKVTFKVANGSWNDGTTADKTVTLTGYEGDTLKLTADQIPAVGKKAADTFKAGKWDVTPNAKTAITGNTTYTYTYAKKDTISAKVTFKVVNGSWNDGKTKDVTVTLSGYEGDTLKLTADQIPAVGKKAADTFKAGSWDVTPNAKTAITGNTTYTYTYAKKDTISATVTFKVVNGSWNDGKTKDVTVTLSGYEGDTLKLTADQIPAVGKKAAKGYKAGSWNVVPDTKTAISKNTKYTYTYVAEEVTPPDDKDGDVSVPEEKQKDNFAGGGLDNTGAEVKESVLTEEDKEQIQAGKNVEVWLEVTDQTETVAEEEKAKVEEAGKELGSGYRVGAYMDLKLWKQVAGKQATKVEEVPNGNVKVSFTIPEGMRKDNATYVIIGLHNGKILVLMTTLDKTTWRVSFETKLFSTYALAYQEQEPETKKSVTEIFTDLDPNAWYINAVQFVYDHALMVGKSATTFDPNAPITREQMVQVIYNNEGKPEAPNANPFNDVVEGSWYQNAVLWANANGVSVGYGGGRFGVADAVTREQMVRMLYNYAILKGYDISMTPGTSDGYADSATISGWAKEAMDWAVEKEIISGKGTQGMDKSQICLDPAGKASRVECAQVLTNFKQKIEK